jgi:site-specific DNA-methyltransferase (adenine-specific)
MRPYYQDDAVTIYHGNMGDMGQLDAVDHIITDPPYEAEAHTLQRRCKGRNSPDGATFWGKREILNMPLDFVAITDDDRKIFSFMAKKIVKRWVLVFCQIEALTIWRAHMQSAGLNYKRACIWVKPNGQPQLSGDRPGMGYETICAMHALGRSTWNGGVSTEFLPT